MVRAMIITADSFLLRPKLDRDGGYDMAVKGPSEVVRGSDWQCLMTVEQDDSAVLLHLLDLDTWQILELAFGLSSGCLWGVGGP